MERKLEATDDTEVNKSVSVGRAAASSGLPVLTSSYYYDEGGH